MKLTPQRRMRWLRYIAALRKKYPTARPVRVRTAKRKTTHGGVLLSGRTLNLYINSESTWAERTDALCHEYAHCCNWSHNSHVAASLDEHDETWGVWYARCYRLIVDEIAPTLPPECWGKGDKSV